MNWSGRDTSHYQTRWGRCRVTRGFGLPIFFLLITIFTLNKNINRYVVSYSDSNLNGIYFTEFGHFFKRKILNLLLDFCSYRFISGAQVIVKVGQCVLPHVFTVIQPQQQQ